MNRFLDLRLNTKDKYGEPVSQTVFAEMLNKVSDDNGYGVFFDRQKVGRIERGVETGYAELKTYSRLCGVSIDYLLGAEECATHDNTFINSRTGLTDEAIQHLNIVHKINPQAAEIRFLNFLLSGSRFRQLANLFDTYISPTMTVLLAEDPASGELTPVTEEVFNSEDTIPRKVTIDFNKDAIGLGFTKDMVEQSIFRKLNDLFSEWRNAWKK